MKRCGLTAFIFMLAVVLAVPGVSCSGSSKTSIKKEEAKTSSVQGRAISLRVLQERLKAYKKKDTYPHELLQLGGLKDVIGYVVDEAKHDLILIGRTKADLPPLHLEDFVIALRNAWLRYAVLKGRTYYYSDPGCSIDPNPEVIDRLRITGKQILGISKASDVEKGIQEWHRVCQSPQQVRVLGIPFHTHFAWVMVRADYDMKRLVDGADTLEIPGFVSLTDLTLERAKGDIVHGRPISIPLSSMNRFWFYPGKTLYPEDKGIVTIKECPVVLLTEEEYLSKGKRIEGKGRSNPLAQSFVDGFTKRYRDVAKERPIYVELENLFRFVALAKIIKSKSAHEQAALDLRYLLDQHPTSVTPVKEHLPGRSNVKHFEHRRDFTGGYQIAQLWMPSCGGVSININISRECFTKDTTGKLAELRAMVLDARPAPDALFWDYPRPKKKVRFREKELISEVIAFVRPGSEENPNL